MGCRASKIDDSPLVSLCRERKRLIRDAANLRYELAASHANYLRSLAGVGDAIHEFVREELVAVPSPPPSPVITLPPSKSKSKSETDGSVTPLSHSLSPDSHIHLSLDSESEKSLKSSPQIGAPSAVQSPNYHFMRSSTGIPSMVYQNPYAWDYPYDYSMSSLPRDPAIEITPPPPPPPPAGGSAWDFFDPFNSYEQFLPQEKYYVIGSGSSSTNSSEVREREGIPDLEEETEQEILKSAKKEKTQMRITDEDLKRKDFGEGTSKAIPEDEKDAEGTIGLEREKESTSVSESSKERSFKEEGGQTKDKGVVLEERSMVTEESGPSNAAARGTKDIMEVVKEINELFKSATACGEEISRMLEVGKVNYRARSRIFRLVSSRILEPLGLCMLTSSQPFKHSQKSATNATKSRGKAAASEHRFGMKSGNISSTLEKLYMWERKLYKEVKVVMLG